MFWQCGLCWNRFWREQYFESEMLHSHFLHNSQHVSPSFTACFRNLKKVPQKCYRFLLELLCVTSINFLFTIFTSKYCSLDINNRKLNLMMVWPYLSVPAITFTVYRRKFSFTFNRRSSATTVQFIIEQRGCPTTPDVIRKFQTEPITRSSRTLHN